IEPARYVSATVGLPTLQDVLAELAKPGRDPRERFEPFRFAEGVSALDDLQPGMRLPGIVTNVTAFGAFVDVGVHQDGLVHVSQLADRFVRDPNEVVKVGDRLSVRVLSVDLKRKFIALSAKKALYKQPGSGEKSQKRTGSTTSQAPGRGQQARPSGFSNNPFERLLKK